eukprot:7100097-Alexandrium_andersonii.AAC.1
MDDHAFYAVARLWEGSGIHEASQVRSWLRRRMAGLTAAADQLRAAGLRGTGAESVPAQVDAIRPYAYLEDYMQEV